MWLEALAVYAREQNVPQVGTSVFIHTMPHDVTPCAMLVSGYNGLPIDPELPGYYKGPMQMIVRAKKSADAESIAQALSDVLHIEQSIQVGAIFINHLRPLHLPAVFPRSNGDFYEASVNFDICFVRV